MLLTLIGRNSINKIVLPEVIMGNYWLSDENKKLINIESVNNHWQIKSSNRLKIYNPNNVVVNNNSINISNDGNEILNKVILENYNFYYVEIGNSKEIYILYCSPFYEDNYTHLHIENTSSILIRTNKKK